MAAGDEHPVCAIFKGFKNESWVNSAAAHYTNNSYVRRILDSAYSSQVRTRIATPVA
jgi:hypothetical protein